MDTIQQYLITEEQQDNRVIKAHEIHILGQIEKLDSNRYLVKDRYIVEQIDEDIFTCTCKDYENRCAHHIFTDEGNYMSCKHILSIIIMKVNGA